MAKAGCTGPDCTFLGDRLNSPAVKGRCTDTRGYVANAEINEKTLLGDNVKSWHDHASSSDIMVYDGTEWVAYMSPTTKATRRNYWRGKNFRGTIDWAVDLQDFHDDDMLGPDNQRPDDPPPPREECKGVYDKLEDIPLDASYDCRGLYVLYALRSMHRDSLEKYDKLLDGGYDKKFNTYADAVVRSGNKQVINFMYTKGKEYFDCTITETISSCKLCRSDGRATNKGCRFCEDWDCRDPICNNPEVNCDGVKYRYRNITAACPPDYSDRSEDQPDFEHNRFTRASTYWTLRNDRQEAFWSDLYLETGIKKEKIAWQDVTRYECEPTEPKQECRNHNHDFNFPVTSSYKREDVLNPKDVFTKAHGKLKTLGSVDDLIDALSLPITMVRQAVEGMSKIDDIVDEWEAAKRKNIILAFLSAIFFFIPIIGEVDGAVASLAGVARILATIGVAGDVALGIYEIVDDVHNAPLAIFGLILEPLALVDVAKISKAARVRRAMSVDDERKLFGAKSVERLDAIRKVHNICKLGNKKRELPIGSLPMSSLTGVSYDLLDGKLAT
ncbi:putative glycoside hydrolase family 18 protein [Hirsutella rhossiliensis]|uniref:Glycoside hydrolase family 18 protein n=1 Tax=Hirsutella rhossiliensis TaxID=111463 RepID=A0A9P8N7N9_9HYPO|nr:putative glycoside hydrolase family 18 protein [Hirsutella rhossiliensis]KAH0967259.1 putative glycoside hydrolase family 18 protein [Hirsutella rhossiliensis]